MSVHIDGVDLGDLAADAGRPLWALEVDDDDFDSDDERERFIAESHDGSPPRRSAGRTGIPGARSTRTTAVTARARSCCSGARAVSGCWRASTWGPTR
ncbi:hypothetical protein [Actinoplanes sp. NPDC049681]|uniref:hypothetical protein n=1 Tax=Actinoplanes sp. NPDC049681 TaxID=3363905 RepID=UPI00379D9CC8